MPPLSLTHLQLFIEFTYDLIRICSRSLKSSTSFFGVQKISPNISLCCDDQNLKSSIHSIISLQDLGNLGIQIGFVENLTSSEVSNFNSTIWPTSYQIVMNSISLDTDNRDNFMLSLHSPKSLFFFVNTQRTVIKSISKMS